MVVNVNKDTIPEGFRGCCQLPYAHWLTYLILRARADPLPPQIQRELIDTVTVFAHYDPQQMMRTHVHLRAPVPPPAPRGPAPAPTPRGTRSSGAVRETEEEQDVAIGSVAEAEAEGEFDFTMDNSDDDYHLPIPDLPPRWHDREASSSTTSMDLALLAILAGSEQTSSGWLRSRLATTESRPPRLQHFTLGRMSSRGSFLPSRSSSLLIRPSRQL